MLKIRSTPTEGEQTGQVREWMTESRKSESNIPAIPNTVRGSVQDKIHHIHQGLVSQQERILELIKRQGNRPERNYIELTPGTPVWVQHRQNVIWEPQQ